jgi:hypothetical protein
MRYPRKQISNSVLVMKEPEDCRYNAVFQLLLQWQMLMEESYHACSTKLCFQKFKANWNEISIPAAHFHFRYKLAILQT